MAIESGFSLTQIGEFAFIIATLGMQLGVLDPTIYPIVVAVSVLTTFTTPYFIRLADPAYNYIERHLPEKLHFLIDRYSKTAGEESETGKTWRAVLKRYVWRILLYATVLTAICLISSHWLQPWLIEIMPGWGRLICTLVTIGAMAPFLLALSYPSSKKNERETLLNANARYDVPLVVLRIFRLMLSMAFIYYAISSIYTPRTGIFAGLGVFILITVVFSKQVRRRMHSIEEKFINNLNERELRRSGHNNNIISNLHMAFVTVGYACPFVGMKLADSGLRATYGINVASIQRGTTAVPAGNIRLFPGDTLSIIGTEDEIQRLLPVIEAQPVENTAGVKATDMKLTSLQLTDRSPLIDKTVAQSELSTRYSSLLVSIMRDDTYITPDKSTTFRPGDILWLVANPKIIAPLH